MTMLNTPGDYIALVWMIGWPIVLLAMIILSRCGVIFADIRNNPTGKGILISVLTLGWPLFILAYVAACSVSFLGRLADAN
jgi:hypothetical protein